MSTRVPPLSTKPSALIAEHGDEAKLLAGGQSLMPLLNFRLAEPRLLIDVNRVSGLTGIHRDNGSIRIGAMTRHRELEASGEAAEAEPLIARAAREIGHLAIRSRGTIGDSIAHADPAAEWPLLAVTLGAQLELRSASGSRTVAAREFFVGPFTTCARADEILTAVIFPAAPAGSGFGFQELCRRPGDFAIVAVACRVRIERGQMHRLCARCRWCRRGTAIHFRNRFCASQLARRRPDSARSRRRCSPSG